MRCTSHLAARVEHGPSRVAGVEGHVALNDIVDGSSRLRSERPPYLRDNTSAHSRAQTQWVPYGNGELAHTDRRIVSAC
jgi:hypothetical protein